MNSELKAKIDGMLELYNSISNDFKWENNLYRHFAALDYTIKNQSYNPTQVKELITYIKTKTGIFSNFRPHAFILSVFLCSRYINPKEMFDKLYRFSENLKAGGFKSSAYLPVAGYSLLATCDEVDVHERINKAYEIYTQIKKLHPWLTSGDDYALCLLLADSSKEVSTIVEEIEICYEELRKLEFSRSNALQFLSHILSFSKESVEAKVLRCKNIYDKLSENHLKIYSSYYASLGLLTLIGENIDQAIEEVVEATNYLKGLKSYKWLGKGMNILIASSLLSMEYIEERKTHGDITDTTLSISIDALIAAQQAASIAGMSAAIAASSASSGT
jgi:hypothetical protein